jgi:phosphonate transport system permease protein
MNRLKESAKFRNGIKIFFWSIFLVFFIYSFQNVMDFEGINNSSRQESFIRVLTAFSKPNFFDSETNGEVASSMWETVQIAFLATSISAFFAIPFTFLSARPSSFWGHGFNFLLQPILSAVRAIHPLIFTVPAIIFVGIGATAGVLALTLFSTAVLIGNFSEYAQQHKSLGWGILFKLSFPGLVLKHLPINILIATILGFMGGGGIGFFIQLHINLLDYSNASLAILACIIVIGSFDLLSRGIWRKIQNMTDFTSLE